MGILAHLSNFQNCIKSTNKIPEYARDFKKEYLFIIGIGKEFQYFIDNIDDATRGLFESHKVDRIKYFIKRFLRGQERGKLKDVSGLILESHDCHNIRCFWLEMLYVLIEYENDIPCYIDFYNLLNEFHNKLNIIFFVSDYYEGGEYV